MVMLGSVEEDETIFRVRNWGARLSSPLYSRVSRKSLSVHDKLFSLRTQELKQEPVYLSLSDLTSRNSHECYALLAARQVIFTLK